jgi:pimeloyl-ACP methyl ester carboxylesterase
VTPVSAEGGLGGLAFIPPGSRDNIPVSTYRHPGTVVTGHFFSVPLDHSRPDGERIEVFAREVTAAASEGKEQPWLVFLQGGPGFAAGRMVARQAWLDRALRDFRVLLLDQRGTGRSTPVSAASLARRGRRDPAAIADYLACFRADAIVLDAELVRRELCGDEPWAVLGQSFGGFCAVTYLSFAPHGVREAMITGGLPGLAAGAEDVYRHTYPIVARKVAAHYDRYPMDVERARDVARVIASGDARLPDGRPLTVRAFQALGHALGTGDGSHELHYLLEDALDGDGELTEGFLRAAWEQLSFLGSPLYAVLHEACYAQGEATRWAAQRVRAQFPAFDPDAALDGDAPLMFTGEMVYPWMVAEDPALARLREAADALAERPRWPPLYDPVRLAAGGVPAAAAVYYDDMYVPRALSEPTAAAIGGLRAWVTSEWEHDGLRVSGGAVLDRLIAMNHGEA